MSLTQNKAIAGTINFDLNFAVYFAKNLIRLCKHTVNVWEIYSSNLSQACRENVLILASYTTLCVLSILNVSMMQKTNPTGKGIRVRTLPYNQIRPILKFVALHNEHITVSVVG